MNLNADFVQEPVFGVAVTVGAYVLAQYLHRQKKWLHPLFVAAGAVILLLLACKIPYHDYKAGGDIIVFFLGPATVALGVPLYKHALLIKKSLRSILVGLVSGSVCGLVSAALFVWMLDGTKELMLTMMPKSATAPVSIELIRQLGGIPELGAALTTLTGLFGSMLGPELLRWTGVKGDIAIGTAIGTSSHGIGTARVLRESEVQGSVSGFCMGVNAIVTSILVIPVYWWLH